MVAEESRQGHNSIRHNFKPTRWRFCEICQEVMMQKAGVLYWKRSHQLWLATYCIDHQAPLKLSKVKMDYTREYIPATFENCPPDSLSEFDGKNNLNFRLLWEMTLNANNFLNQTEVNTDRTDQIANLNTVLKEKGYQDRGGRVMWSKLQPNIDRIMVGLGSVFPKLCDNSSALSIDLWLPRLYRGERPAIVEAMTLAQLFIHTAPKIAPLKATR